MKRLPLALYIALAAVGAVAQEAAPLRPPAVPLVAHDPYFSIWSAADELNRQPTKHWTGSEQPLTGLIRIDGVTRRWMGGQLRGTPPVEPMRQTSFRLTPTRTMYEFEAAGVKLKATFLTPALAGDMETLSKPVTYLVWEAASSDGRPHNVKLYLDAGSLLAVNTNVERAVPSRHRVGGMEVVRLTNAEQPVLAKSGDDLRIDWGSFYMAAPAGAGRTQSLVTTARKRQQYIPSLNLPEARELDDLWQIDRDTAVVALAIDLGQVTSPVEAHALLAYDDVYSIEYFRRKLRPYWRRGHATAEDLLRGAEKDFAQLRERTAAFDRELTADLVKAGGPRYAALAILAYRQALAAHKLAADIDGSPLHFSKENFSNGCIATVDVTYPGAPLFLLLNPQLVKAQLRPIFDYAKTGRWPWPYAPHDLGQYPLANGQVYGGGEESENDQMPVEESGNILILSAALAKAEGNAEFTRPYFPLLTRWAEYLRNKGLDPENQLNTDDFAGHMAHNTNLSIKAIVALASYARLAGELGQPEAARSYRALAEKMAAQWTKMAADGDHYRLAFDQPGSWSQKYNLVWDKLLGLKLFPPEIARTEIAYYKRIQHKYGLPLDNRSDYTKLDWIVWTATMAGNRTDFEALVDPVYNFANESKTRVPLTDWYWTTAGTQRGFQARSVVGGVFIKLLEDEAVWKKWASRAK